MRGKQIGKDCVKENKKGASRRLLDFLVTGGAGFIGSHLVDALVTSGAKVCVFDNLSSGLVQNIERWFGDPNFYFIEGDLLNPADLEKLRKIHCEAIFHLAANPEVKVGTTKPEAHFQQNVLATFNLLEILRKYKIAKALAFASSSTVYGEAKIIPTREDYAPLEPISIYGASKLSCEILIGVYARTYDFKAIIYRIANVVGPRSRHGVIYDFIQKLRANPRELEILGDGTQTKSYLYVSDCIEAMLLGLEKLKSGIEVYNVGSEDQLNVKTIAQIVSEEMGLENVKFICTGGVDGGRGWKGDVKHMLLDINKLKSLGWKPKYNSEQAVRRAANEAIAELLRYEKNRRL